MCKLHEIDPDGDLLIMNSLTEEAFALWIDPDDELTGSPRLSENDPTIDISPSFMHFKVSSKHMSLASRRFKIMLSGDWKEAKTIHEDGYRHVVLDNGFDSSALLLLLYIIHGKTHKVPRSLDLEMLAKVSVLVDDFKCYEEVAIFVDIWLKKPPKTIPTEYGRDLVLWILIASVFRKPKYLQSATRVAILHTTEPIQTLGLPISGIIIDEVDGERQALLDKLIETLHDLFNKLRTNNQPLCSFQCDSMLLGAFVQQLDPHHLIWPKPLKPFNGFGLAKTAEIVRDLQSPAWCDMSEKAAAPQSSEDIMQGGSKKKAKQKNSWAVVTEEQEVQKCDRHGCTFQDHIISKVNRLEKSVKGFDSEEYLKT